MNVLSVAQLFMPVYWLMTAVAYETIHPCIHLSISPSAHLSSHLVIYEMTFLLWEGSSEPLNCWLPPLFWPCSHRWHLKGVAVAYIILSLMGFWDIWTVPSWFIFQPASLSIVLNQIHQTEFFRTIKVAGDGKRKIHFFLPKPRGESKRSLVFSDSNSDG